MTKRKPTSINPCLKAKAYGEKENGTVIATGVIEEIKDLPQTQHGDKVVITIKANEPEKIEELEMTDEQQKESLIDVFVNNYTLTKLCDEFGEEDTAWIGKHVKVTKEFDTNFKSPMLVIQSNTESV